MIFWRMVSFSIKNFVKKLAFIFTIWYNDSKHHKIVL